MAGEERMGAEEASRAGQATEEPWAGGGGERSKEGSGTARFLAPLATDAGFVLNSATLAWVDGKPHQELEVLPGRRHREFHNY